MLSKKIIAVIGANQCDSHTYQMAYEVGYHLAKKDCILVTGGLMGVMEGASKGAKEGGGLVVGILPGNSPREANPFVDIPIVTAMGDARNAIIANTSDAFIAITGSYGTLSEIAFALKRNKKVVSLGSWEVDPAIIKASNPIEAVKLLFG